MQFQKLQSKQLSQDYICWRLAKSGHYQWPILDSIDVSKNNRNKLFLCMRSLAHQFEMIYNANFAPLAAKFHLTSANCRDTYFTISDQLFLDTDAAQDDLATFDPSADFSCHWGKIVGLFAFSGSLAVRCFEKDMAILVYHIIDWLAEYLNNRKFVSKWIIANSSWAGFVDYFYQNSEYLDIKLDDYLLDAEAASRKTPESSKKKRSPLPSSLLKRRSRISSAQSKTRTTSSSSMRLNSQDSLEQKFETKNEENEEADGASSAFIDESADQAEASTHITYLNSSGAKRAALKKNAQTAFCQISKCLSIAAGSLGVLTLGAMYIKK